MKTLLRNTCATAAQLALLTVLIIACTKSSADPDAIAARLEKRVAEIWDCRVTKDYDRKYDMMSPDIRDRVSKKEFVSSKGFVNYYSFEILKLEIEGETATVSVKYRWKADHPLFEKAPIKEAVTEDPWVYIDGEWYMKYRTPSITGAPDNVQQQKKDDLE